MIDSSFSLSPDTSAAASAVRFCRAALLGCAVLLGACGQAPTELPVEPNASRASTDDPGIIARQVVADFLSVPTAEVTLVSVEAKDFGDPSLGCPAPGMAYPQVITPGHRVIVEAEGRRFDVRVSGKSGKICRKPSGNTSRGNSNGSRPDQTAPVTSEADRARSDLASQLGLDEADIAIADVRPWARGIERPGCRPKCAESAASCGFLVGLIVDGRRYEYHAHAGRATPCPALRSI